MKKDSRFKLFLFFFILIGFFLSLSFSFSVNAPISLGAEPQSGNGAGKSIDQMRGELQSQLDAALKEIDAYQSQIDTAKKEGNTLKNEISILENKVSKLRTQIRALNLTIEDLRLRVSDTKQAIQKTETQIDYSKELLTRALQSYQDKSATSPLEIFLANDRLSDFFIEVNALSSLTLSIKEEADHLKKLKETLDNQRGELEDQEDQNTKLKSLQELQRKDLDKTASQKNNLLAQTKGRESSYQNLLKKSQQTAAELRRQLFQLAGGTGPVSLEEAARIATLAAQATGIRPALLLALLDYESKLGKNVGKCSWRDSMSPTRDKPAFLQITSELGIDPDSVMVACPQWYGTYAGAMGPAQFIPSTWLLFKDKVAQMTGHNPPSPWNIFDAFFATAIKLSDDGAAEKTYKAEWKAAMIYFAGRNWSKPQYRFYGDNVMDIAADYDEKLKILNSGQ